MVVTSPTPEPNNVGWAIEDYDELSSDLSIFVEVETFRGEELHFDPRASVAYGPSRTIVRRSSFYGPIDEIELDGPPIYQLEQHPQHDITRLIGSVGGKPWIIARLLDARNQNPASTTPSRSKDMTEYTDDQVNEAIMLANQTGKVYAWETEMYRNVIKHLPKPQDDWQSCTFEDIRKGDRVRRVFTYPNGSAEASEGIAAKKEPGFATHWRWVDQDGLILGLFSDNDDPHVTFSRISDALPEPDPQDDWQSCTFEDVRKGDRVKEVVKQDDGTTQTIEGVASYLDTRRDKHSWNTRDGFELALDDYALDSHLVTLYRIPAPVRHPDPKEQLVILVRGAYNVEWSNTYAFVSDGSGYCIVEPTSDSRLLPESITNWEPADIVPKVVEDDR